jgi:2-polyprenyl-3-methyl-5-hydroxy-6-metoxy-1,4-benzoquinol methylase
MEADLRRERLSVFAHPLIERWSPGKRVLDLGCGASQLLPMLMKRGYDAVGFEGGPARAGGPREWRHHHLG